MNNEIRSEKERVYTELVWTRKRVASLRREVESLKNATSAEENAALRREAAEYRKALSIIHHRAQAGTADLADVVAISHNALILRGLKAHVRDRIEKAHEQSPA